MRCIAYPLDCSDGQLLYVTDNAKQPVNPGCCALLASGNFAKAGQLRTGAQCFVLCGSSTCASAKRCTGQQDLDNALHKHLFIAYWLLCSTGIWH